MSELKNALNKARRRMNKASKNEIEKRRPNVNNRSNIKEGMGQRNVKSNPQFRNNGVSLNDMAKFFSKMHTVKKYSAASAAARSSNIFKNAEKNHKKIINIEPGEIKKSLRSALAKITPPELSDLYDKFDERATERAFRELSCRWVHSVLEGSTSDVTNNMKNKEQYCVGDGLYCDKTTDLKKGSELYKKIHESTSENETLTNAIIDEINAVRTLICSKKGEKLSLANNIEHLNKYLRTLRFIGKDLALKGTQFSTANPDEKPKSGILGLRTCSNDSSNSDFHLVLEELKGKCTNRLKELKDAVNKANKARNNSKKRAINRAAYNSSKSDLSQSDLFKKAAEAAKGGRRTRRRGRKVSRRGRNQRRGRGRTYRR